MGLFGQSKKNVINCGKVQATENLPVATLVYEETTFHNMPESTAPLNPSVGENIVGGGNCCVAAASSSNKKKNSGANNYANDPTVSRSPMMMAECPNCHRESRTRVTTAPSWKTWAATGCLFCVFWPLCWVPLVVDSCKTTDHFCVTCGSKVAKVGAFQDCCVEHRG